MRREQHLVLGAVRAWCGLRYLMLLRRSRDGEGRWPDAVTPRTDTDRFVWRKIFDHNPLFVTAGDKLAAKDYALRMVPELKTAKVLWSGDDAAELAPAHFAGDTVLKANRGSGWYMLVRDGRVDIEAARRKARRWLARNYGRRQGEWGYFGARKLIFIEEMLHDDDGGPVATEYKLHISGGRLAYAYVKRRVAVGEDIWGCFERDGHPILVRNGELAMPQVYPRMIELAERLAAPFDHIRVDLYAIGGDLYFSELTAYPISGRGLSTGWLQWLRCRDWDLRRSWFLSHPQRGWKRLYAEALRAWLDEQPVPVEPPRQ